MGAGKRRRIDMDLGGGRRRAQAKEDGGSVALARRRTPLSPGRSQGESLLPPGSWPSELAGEIPASVDLSGSNGPGHLVVAWAMPVVPVPGTNGTK